MSDPAKKGGSVARWTATATAMMMAALAVPAAPGEPPKPSCKSLPQGPANANLGNQESADDPLVVGTNSNARDLSTRGGLVAVGVNGQAGQITTKTGPVLIGPSGTVSGISTESGSIETCNNSRVSGDVTTATGSITVGLNGAVGRIVVRAPAALPATPPVIRLGRNAEAGGIDLAYPVRICLDVNATGGDFTGAKPLPCK